MAASTANTITLDANGGTIISENQQVLVTDDNRIAPPLPVASMDNYVFNGWWTSVDKGSILKPNDRVPSSQTTYYAHWTEITDETSKIASSFYGKTTDDTGTWSVTYNYGEIGTVNKGFTYNYGTIGTVSAGASAGTYNYGTIGNYASTKSASGLSYNYGVIDNNTGNVSGNYGVIKNNTGNVSDTYENSVTINNGGTISSARNGIIYNYSGTVTQWWAGGSAKVYNFAGGIFVYSSNSDGATIYDLGGQTSGTPGRYNKTVPCHKVSIAGNPVNIGGDFITDASGNIWLPEDGTGTITPAGAENLYTTSGTLTKNSDGTYTLTGVTQDTAISDTPSYAISYDLDGGTMAEGKENPTSYTEKDTFTLNNPQDKMSKDGTYVEYYFAGWTGTDLTEPTKLVTVSEGSTGERSYKATWTPNPDLVSITFKYEADSPGVVKKYDKNDAGQAFGTFFDDAELAAYIAKTGYTFDGWYTEPDAGEKVTSESLRPEQDTTYYARWNISTVTITLDAAGGTDGGNRTGEYRDPIGILPVSTRTGYIFNGWWSKDAKGNWSDVISSRTYFPAADTTYYARWTKKTEDNTTTFINGVFGFDGFFNATGENRGSIQKNYGEIGLVTAAGSVADNFSRIGIYKSTSGISNNYGLIENNKGEIWYNYNLMTANNGALKYNEGELDTNNRSIDDNRGTISLNAESGKIDRNDGTIVSNEGTVDRNYTVIERNAGTVSENSGTVQYNSGTVEKNTGIVRNFGGTITENRGGTVSTFYSVDKGTDNIEKINYGEAFDSHSDLGWLEQNTGSGTFTLTMRDGAPVDAYIVTADNCTLKKNEDDSFTVSHITGNVLISAKAVDYRIRYELDGGKNAAENPEFYTYETETITLKDPAKTGYTFGGWYANSALSGNAVTEIPQKSMDDKIFYAKWTANTYTVTFDANGGEGDAIASMSFVYDAEQKLPDNTFSNEGNVFAGWNTAADGKCRWYGNQAVVKNMTAEDRATVTLYAQWRVPSSGGSSGGGGGSATKPSGENPENPEDPESPENPVAKFTDVSEGSSYYQAISWAVQNGITVGTSENTFSPDATCTRAQIVTFLYRAAGSPEVSDSVTCSFEDVQVDDYFYDAVRWAYSNEITVGTSDTTFHPDGTCTRAQSVAMIHRSEGSPEVSGKSHFSDVDESHYFHDAVVWAVKNEITFGTSESTFSPHDGCTRAQIVTFLHRNAV